MEGFLILPWLQAIFQSFKQIKMECLKLHSKFYFKYAF